MTILKMILYEIRYYRKFSYDLNRQLFIQLCLQGHKFTHRSKLLSYNSNNNKNKL